MYSPPPPTHQHQHQHQHHPVATAPATPATPGAAVGAPTDYSDKQPTLRVMRLYKPRLNTPRVLPRCTVGVGGAPRAAAGGTGAGMRGAGVIGVDGVGRAANSEDGFALSSALKLPDSFGNIYLGEAFTAYIR